MGLRAARLCGQFAYVIRANVLYSEHTHTSTFMFVGVYYVDLYADDGVVQAIRMCAAAVAAA